MVLMLSKGILVHPHLDKGLRIIVHSRKQNKTKQNKHTYDTAVKLH